MKYRNVLTGEVFEAEWRTDHAASSYGQPVLVRTDTGEVVDRCYLIAKREIQADGKEKK